MYACILEQASLAFFYVKERPPKNIINQVKNTKKKKKISGVKGK